MQKTLRPLKANTEQLDVPLSWNARGVLCYLREHPDQLISVPNLVEATKGAAKETGREGVYSIINELIAAGHLERQTHRDKGQIRGLTYTLISPSATNQGES